MPRIVAALLCCLLSASPSFAGVYTWIDEQGVAHFSDHPPPQQPHRQVDIRPVATVPMSENLKQGQRVSEIRDDVQNVLSRSDRPVKTSAKARARERAEREKTCAGYRRQLETIQSQLRSGYSNDRGNSLRQRRRVVSQKLSKECILS